MVVGSTNFLQFNEAAVNQETDAQYIVDPLRTGGAAVTGELPSPLFNKVMYQGSTFYAAFCRMMANKGFTTSDVDINVLSAVLANIQTSEDVKPLQVTIPFSPTPVFDCSLASSFRFSLSGNVASSILINIPPPGGIMTFFIVSSSPGNFSFAWPANVINGFNVQNQSAGNLFTQEFISDGASLFAIEGTLVVLSAAVVGLQVFEANQEAENTDLTTLANAAQGTANTAVSNAATAQNSANIAGANANAAAIAAAAAQSTANTGVANAATAQTAANLAAFNATNALTNAAAAQGTANTAISEIAALQVVYTRNDVTGSRSFNASFTNPYGKPMRVSGYGNTQGNDIGSVQCFVNGDGDFADTIAATIDNGACGFSFDVPTGGTYQINTNTMAQGGHGVTSIGKWIETVASV